MARGGKREGAGRPAGASTKTGAELREAAQAYTTDALSTLAEVMADKEETGAARVAAANAILDRGFGKPKQTMDVDADVRTEVVTRVALVGPDDDGEA